MDTREATHKRPIQKRSAIERRRRITVIVFNLVFGMVVTASGGQRITDYKLPKRGAKATLTIRNGP